MPTQRDISTRRFAARVILLLSVFYTSCSGEELTAWDYIMKANMGKEKLMNVHKFDIRLPRFRSGAGEGELDAAARDETRLWTGGVVPYVVLRSLRDRPMYKTNLQKAMKEWMTYTCIKFRPRKPTDRDYVVFGYGVGCNADVGRRGNRQYVSLGKGCSDTSVIIHEIGHVVGFWHEQNRPDRNKYVDILWENIIAEYKFAFDEYTEYRIDSRNVTYDYQSIMHYGNYAFSSNKRPTIVAKNSKVKSFGNRHLSPLDIKQANLVYKCPAKDSMYPKFPEDFLFSAKGTLTDKRCILINEPRKRSQNLTWLCHKKTERNADIHWSHNGKISNMDCTHISSPFGKDRKGLWNDNYLCVANDSVYKFHWSKSVPIAGLGCLRWPERTRKDRYRAFLCAKFTSGPIDGGWSSWSSWTKCSRGCGGGYQERRRYCTNPEPKNYGKPCYGRDYWRRYCNKQRCAEYPVWPTDFEFSYFPYTPYEKNCIRVYEREAELYWRNFYFCSVGHKRRINMRWSDMGRQSNMRCTKIYEPEDRQGWDNNYLCVPRSSKYRFEWSHSGPKRGLQCIKWFVKNDTNGWDDNYLCSRGLSYKNVITTSALTASFAVDGGWSKWSNWSHCSKTCGQGYQERIRSCTQPSPSSGGKNCSGRPLEKKSCKITDCPMACNGEFRGNRGKLISPKFPYYPQNSKCHWTITVPEGKRIEMRFTYMRLKASHSKCSSDNLVVRDGHNTRSGVLEKFCRNYKSPQTIQSTGNNMYLQLQTTNALRRGGFKAEWSAKDIPKSKKTNCGAKLTALSGTITSPFYPKKYPHNKECTWLITVPIDRLLTIKFDTFHMESHKSCAYDKLEVFDGITEKAPKRTFCGRKRPDNITAFMNTLLIKFRSDSTRHYRGFKISWSTKKRTFP